jgi:hypothetical protein
MRADLETTRQIARNELLGLLEVTSAAGDQRVTAEMPIATPDDPLCAMPFGTPELVVRFNTGSVPSIKSQRSMVIAISFVASLLIGITLAALLM